MLLESEFGIVRLPNNPQWLGFRDVAKVNAKTLGARDRRLSELFENPTAGAIEQARRIALESARFNIGPVTRTINDPAVLLELLDGRNAHRMKFQKDGEEKLDGIPAWIVRFAASGPARWRESLWHDRGRMAIIPTIRCSHMKSSLEFYTKILDFKLAGGEGDTTDPAHIVLRRAGDTIFLSSHSGDGVFGQHVVVITEDVDALFQKFLARGLVPPERDSPVHHGPTAQSWGTREFYVDDPDDNTVVFVEE